ncbi:hypothetical protein IM725_03690 [Ramlibacter aquaticus]|uniref:Uncharacterized protein n=1 Tax=Ramlibacter aquaticus TaxID=2780094 RepID=A0ABR9SBF9_9BURK|nr:hypothetical protein [Ramlibacter aquaticus]
MREIKLYWWWMPPLFPGGRHRLSTWHMTEEEGAEYGLTERDESSLRVDLKDEQAEPNRQVVKPS